MVRTIQCNKKGQQSMLNPMKMTAESHAIHDLTLENGEDRH